MQLGKRFGVSNTPDDIANEGIHLDNVEMGAQMPVDMRYMKYKKEKGEKVEATFSSPPFSLHITRKSPIAQLCAPSRLLSVF